MKKLVLTFAVTLSLVSHAQIYKFYQTDNIHNQLRLNIKTGKVYLIQDDGQKFLVHAGGTSGIKNDDLYLLYKTHKVGQY
jgi:hypothetical protein